MNKKGKKKNVVIATVTEQEANEFQKLESQRNILINALGNCEQTITSKWGDIAEKYHLKKNVVHFITFSTREIIAKPKP